MAGANDIKKCLRSAGLGGGKVGLGQEKCTCGQLCITVFFDHNKISML